MSRPADAGRAVARVGGIDVRVNAPDSAGSTTFAAELRLQRLRFEQRAEALALLALRRLAAVIAAAESTRAEGTMQLAKLDARVFVSSVRPETEVRGPLACLAALRQSAGQLDDVAAGSEARARAAGEWLRRCETLAQGLADGAIGAERVRAMLLELGACGEALAHSEAMAAAESGACRSAEEPALAFAERWRGLDSEERARLAAFGLSEVEVEDLATWLSRGSLALAPTSDAPRPLWAEVGHRLRAAAGSREAGADRMTVVVRARPGQFVEGVASGPTRLTVIDAAGRLVRRLEVDRRSRYRWDLTAADGRAARPGLYFLTGARGPARRVWILR